MIIKNFVHLLIIDMGRRFMIKNSSFDKEYFIVLKPEGDVLKLARFLQKRLVSEFQLYPNNVYPEIHITLDRIYKKKLKDAVKIIKSTLVKYSEIDIFVKNFDCYSFKDNNFLVLNVEENKKLVNFSRELHEKLEKAHISTIDNYKEWRFHISLASTVFAEKQKKFNEDFKHLCFRFDGVNTPRSCRANIIEIWKPTLDEDNKLLERFKL